MKLGEVNIREPVLKKARSFPEPMQQGEHVQVLVLVIDEARSLIEKKDASEVIYFRLVRKALTDVNNGFHEQKRKVLFVKAVIRGFTPELSKDSSSRCDHEKNTRLFPPFVLTHTMDVALNRHRSPEDPPFDYNASVLEANPDKLWDTLVSMGRPLWHSYITTGNATSDTTRGVLFSAESTLLSDLSPVNKDSFKADTLNGVASLLCRLDLRPQSNSALASKVVVDFMAVFHYVNYTQDIHICGYVTEPVLTFAATHLRYELTPLPLQAFILPQFQELVMQGAIDLGAMGNVVVRIFLLLAMDATIKSNESGGFTLAGGKNRFKGQFCSVKQFLGQLDGSCKARVNSAEDREERYDNRELQLFNVSVSRQQHTSAMDIRVLDQMNEESATKEVNSAMQVTDDASPAQQTSFRSWMDDWESWSVGFSHSVELSTMPTEMTLWFLLSRRAAGVFPRNQKRADLIVPIFCRSTGEVSFMLVRVKNEACMDFEFPQSALGELTPASVLHVDEDQQDKHALSEFSPRKMIRIFMSLREQRGPVVSHRQGWSHVCERRIVRTVPSRRLRLGAFADVVVVLAVAQGVGSARWFSLVGFVGESEGRHGSSFQGGCRGCVGRRHAQ